MIIESEAKSVDNKIMKGILGAYESREALACPPMNTGIIKVE